MSRFAAGAGLRLLAVFLITCMSALIHAVGEAAALGQIIFWRSAVALVPIILYMSVCGDFPAALRTRRPGSHALRSLFGAFSMGCSFLSLIHLPVANASALGYLAPVLTLPLAALWLGERLTPRLALAVAAGFGGAMAFLWEALEAPGSGALTGLAAGLAYALTMAVMRVHVKQLTKTESTASIAFYFALTCAVGGLASLPFGWPVLPIWQIAALAAAGLLGGLAHIAATEAIARAPVSAIAPFDFTGLVWAAGFDLVIFAHLPGLWGSIGMAAILTAALLALRPGRASVSAESFSRR